MNKSCFVIMGFGIKKNINLDLTYEQIIKPCINQNNLIPYPLYQESQFNAFRCDEISGSTSIDYKFVTCLNGADIVIADISTMNVNAIYELGARHALKPRSTILLCAEDKKNRFNFFDLTYVPIIFYEHQGPYISKQSVNKTREKLNEKILFAINSTTSLPDNPIQRALAEYKIYENKSVKPLNLYGLYIKGRDSLDNNKFVLAEKYLSHLYSIDQSEENLMMLILAKYKIAEQEESCKKLIDCINLITDDFDVDSSTSETLFGRLAAICLRVFNLTKEAQYYHSALEYYRRGSSFSKTNLYCPRNYCALLCRVYEITEDSNIIKEYFYTAKHYSKLFLNMPVSALNSGDYTQRIYYTYNKNDMESIILGEYKDYDKLYKKITADFEIKERQRTTIIEGMKKLKQDLEQIESIIKPSSSQETSSNQ